MKPADLPSPNAVESEQEIRIAVPGLSKLVEGFRRAYPDLSEEAIARILRLPPRIVEARKNNVRPVRRELLK